MTRIVRFGRRVKGGGIITRLNVDSDIMEVELDPKLFAEPVVRELEAEAVRRIGAISKQPKDSTIKRRGRGALFNVTGRLRSGIAREFEKSWRLVLPIDRALPRSVMNRLRATAKLGLQSLLKAPLVRAELEKTLERAIKRVIRRVP